MLTIDYSVRCRKEKVTDELKQLVERAIETTLEFEQIEDDCEVSVTFVGNTGIRRFNAEYRGIDRVTDVLSFPLFDFEGSEEPAVDELENMLGDIVISLERAEAQAEEYGHSFEREVAFLTVHSMLHLLGYDHVNSEEEELDMRRRQTAIMEMLGLAVK